MRDALWLEEGQGGRGKGAAFQLPLPRSFLSPQTRSQAQTPPFPSHCPARRSSRPVPNT